MITTTTANLVRHADSQIGSQETVDLLEAAVRDPACRYTRRTVKGRQAGRAEILGYWFTQCPDTPLHQVAIKRAVDGEACGFESDCVVDSDAMAVYEHLSSEIDNPSDDDHDESAH